MLYLAAMVGSRFNPELTAMKQRLQEAGKPPKVILIAVRSKATHDPQCDRSGSDGVEAKTRIEKLDSTVACYTA